MFWHFEIGTNQQSCKVPRTLEDLKGICDICEGVVCKGQEPEGLEVAYSWRKLATEVVGRQSKRNEIAAEV